MGLPGFLLLSFFNSEGRVSIRCFTITANATETPFSPWLLGGLVSVMGNNWPAGTALLCEEVTEFGHWPKSAMLVATSKLATGCLTLHAVLSQAPRDALWGITMLCGGSVWPILCSSEMESFFKVNNHDLTQRLLCITEEAGPFTASEKRGTSPTHLALAFFIPPPRLSSGTFSAAS